MSENQNMEMEQTESENVRACSGSVSIYLLFAFAQVRKRFHSRLLFRNRERSVSFHSRIDREGGIEGGVVALFKLYRKIKVGIDELLAISELKPSVYA